MNERKLLEEARDTIAGLGRPEVYEYRTMENLLARIDAHLKSGGWMPIESAPRDGTEILGWRDDCGVLLIRWDAPINFCTEKECEELGEEAAEAEDWFCADFVSGSRLEGDEIPTHWQPLPPLPGDRDE